MAKNASFPMMKSSGGVLSKLVGFAVTVLVVMLAIQHPVEAGHLLTSLLTGLGSMLNAV